MPTVLTQFSQINPKTFPQTLQTLLLTHQKRIEACLTTETTFTWDNLMCLLEDAEDEIEKHWGPFAHLHAVKNTPELRSAYEDCLPHLTQFQIGLQQNKALYRAIQSIDLNTVSSTQKKIIEDTLRDFRLSGVTLPEKDKKRLETIEARLSTLAAQFENHLIDAELAFELVITDQSKLKGLPEHTLETAKARAKDKDLEGWMLSLDYPCYHAVMTYAEDRPLRETLYRAYLTKASELGPHAKKFDNTPLIHEILTLRQEQAHLLNFSDFSTLSLSTKMAQHTEAVLTFLEELRARAYPQAKKEWEALQKFAVEKLNLAHLEPWDIAFTSDQKKQLEFAFSEESLRPYFSSQTVWQGIKIILKTLYNISLEAVSKAETWDEQVECLAVKDSQQNTLGYLYLDLFARPHKRSGAWMDSLQTRRITKQKTLQLPIATLTCNFAPPKPKQEAAFLHEEVLTLFHELGHCLHHLLTQVNDFSASGLHGVEWDAVELPSQFFENWCWDPKALLMLTQQNPLPEDKIQALRATQTFQSGLALLRQLEFSFIDMLIHTEPQTNDPQGIDKIIKEVRQKTNILPLFPENRFINSFSHIFAGGYAAGYYSYLWAEVLSSDAFSRFEEEGILNTQTGQDFLHAILETGSSRSMEQSFISFRGRAPKPDAFLRHRGLS